MKKIFVVLILVFVLTIPCAASAEDMEYSKGTVVGIKDETPQKDEFSSGLVYSVQIVEVAVTEGPYEGEMVEAEYQLNFGFDERYTFPLLTKGTRVLLYLEETDTGTYAVVVEIIREKYLLWLIILFCAMLLAIGRTKGLKAVISLVLTGFAIFKILIPQILDGRDPVLITALICIGVTGITLLIISGFNRKTLGAVLGTSGGILAACVIAVTAGNLAKLTGLGDNQSQMLMYIPQDITIDFKGLLFAGILIGTMGATMDVGMSIASSMHEIRANSGISGLKLFNAGMNVGRDIMATMSNTLILAYAGSSLQLILLLAAHNTSFSHVINWDVMSSEIIRALSGSMGILLTIPLTSFFCAYHGKKEMNVKKTS